VSQLIPDPNSATAFYAVSEGGANGQGAGVYRIILKVARNVAVTTVTNLTGDLPVGVFGGPQAQLSVSTAGMQPLYLAAITPNGTLHSVFWLNTKDLNPATKPVAWNLLSPQPPAVYRGSDTEGGQGATHLSLVADPKAANLVYVGGDTWPSTNGPWGALARGNTTNKSWTSETILPTLPASLPGKVIPTRSLAATAPHPDSRVMVFDGANTILEGDDGGIYKLTDANGDNAAGLPVAPVWTSVNGNLADTELYAAAFGNAGGPTFLGGAQDNAVFTFAPNANKVTVWSDVFGGDGTAVLADPGHKVSYLVVQEFGLGRLADGSPNSSRQFPPGVIVGAPNRTLNAQVATDMTPVIERLPFFTAVALNSAGNLLVGGNRTLYLSTDQAQTFTSLGGLNMEKTNALPVPAITGRVTAIAYGNAANANIAYVGDDMGNIYVSTDVRLGPTGAPMSPFTKEAALPQVGPGGVLGIAIDPNNAMVAYAVTSRGVFMTTDGGTAWTKLTGNLLDVIQTAGSPNPRSTLRCLTLVKNIATNTDALLVGGLGGVFRLSIAKLTPPANPTWSQYGQSMPDVLVESLDYRPSNQQLLAGTLGRGIWAINATNTSLADPNTLQVTGTKPMVVQDPNNPRNWLATDGNGNTLSIPKALVQTILA
jgi:hypothetical protein